MTTGKPAEENTPNIESLMSLEGRTIAASNTLQPEAGDSKNQRESFDTEPYAIGAFVILSTVTVDTIATLAGKGGRNYPIIQNILDMLFR